MKISGYELPPGSVTPSPPCDPTSFEGCGPIEGQLEDPGANLNVYIDILCSNEPYCTIGKLILITSIVLF